MREDATAAGTQEASVSARNAVEARRGAQRTQKNYLG